MLAEKFAKDRLRALARVESAQPGAVPGVLFLCVHNAGRSQMAAAWLEALGDPSKVSAISAGTEPGTPDHTPS